MNIALVILAAGASSRMGQPKQLLKIDGQSLLKRTVEMSLDTNFYPICVVIGANKQQIVPELVDIPVTIIDNPDWQQGMASSIKRGLIGVYLTQKDIDAVIFMTCDMPFVDEKTLAKLAKKAMDEPNCLVVASRYDENNYGIPALFKRACFNDLLEISGEEGAKSVLKKYKMQAAFIDFPEGKFDLDTLEEYEKFRNHVSEK